ncbi:Macro domain protein [Candidatus Methylomirabilis lanthanidiphila]|uniref:Macro domain protein n=1 Tax=Candidatus Methylomirabilis lanthanidiphila TaxID=2211376 RepID=A0A564ZMK7_9BACT|nr:macro domain-containing protein [Candidatus Methylomirabilis lanthanidiphila]VUZ86326.1 Macro domain protein [Candidatus Methylomirabilis lanthanidiphila]
MRILVGDILQSKAQTLINTVNCVGVMGKGIALEFKKRFPDMYDDYVKRCERSEVKPGAPYIYKTLFPPQIINFPTKEHWKSISRLSDIERGLKHLIGHYQEWGVTSLAMPPLGCGNGQLEWRVVGPLMYRFVKDMAIPVELYAPYGTHPKELTMEFLEHGAKAHTGQTVRNRQAALNPAWVALVEIVARIEQQPYHWPIGRTLFQKIAYVATNEGLPTGLRYQRGSFGPFSDDLKSVETALVNNGLLQEERRGRMFVVKVGPNFSRIRQKYTSYFEQRAETLEKAADLFMRVNTDQAEVITTVLFTARELAQERREPPSETEVLESVMQWKQKRLPPLDQRTVASTIRNLATLKWLAVTADPKLPVPEEEAIPV